MLIVWVTIRGEREAIVQPKGLAHVSKYDCQYASGLAAPHYPLPAISEWFEFGWNLTKSEASLLHVKREAYHA